MKKTLLGIIILAFLASCSPSEEQIAQAILQTQASAPTAKPTRTPLPTPRYSNEEQYVLIGFCEDYLVFLNAQIEFLDEYNPWIEATRMQSAPDPDGARRLQSLADSVWDTIMAVRRPEPALPSPKQGPARPGQAIPKEHPESPGITHKILPGLKALPLGILRTLPGSY